MTDRTEASLEPAVAALYGAPLADFIRSRDALAKELRSAGERESASHVKSLRKPSRAAWALDRLVHQAPEHVSGLEAAVADLIDAHSGNGDVRAAMAALRGAVRECAARAQEEAHDAGFALDGGDLANAILAVLGNPDSYDAFRAGRLVDIPEAGGLDFLSSLPARPKLAVSSAPRSRASKGTTRPAGPPEVDPAEAAAARERERQAALARDAARAAAQAAANELKEADDRVAAARDKVRAAEAELKAAQQRQEFARRKESAASAELRKADAAVGSDP